MDQIKNALSGNSSKEEKPANAQSSGQNQDYGDKGKANSPDLAPDAKFAGDQITNFRG